MRDIKFRGKEVTTGEWIYGSLVNNLWHYSEHHSWNGKQVCEIIQSGECDDYSSMEDAGLNRTVDPETAGQFTGLTLNGVDLYDGDVIRVEEDAPDIDEEDKMNWYVVVFVQEWCMYAMLHTKNEYFQYLKDGRTELDEVLFWTFPITNTKDNPEKYFLCGNIYDNPELLTR